MVNDEGEQRGGMDGTKRPGSVRSLTPRGSDGRSVDGEGGLTARRESNVYKDILAEMESGARGELPTLHEQIEAVRPAPARASTAHPPVLPLARTCRACPAHKMPGDERATTAQAGWGRFQVRALTAFVLFVVSEAMVVTVPNVVWDKVKDGDTFGPTVEGPGSASFRAIVVGAPLLGNIVGSVLGGVVADTYGRHAAIYVHSTLFTGASLWSAMSVDKTSFVMSRVVLGISLGIIIPVLVSFMAELAPVAKRARAVVIIPGFGFPCGQVLMLMTGLLLQRYLPKVPEIGAAGDASAQLHKGLEAQLPTGLEWWRWLMVAGIVPNVVALVLVRLYVPESPHFLLGVGETQKAERVLRTIAQVNKTEALLLRGGRVRPSQGSQDRVEGGKWETKIARTKRLGVELLSPPLHEHMLRLLGMWMLAGLGQFGTDTILPKVLEKQHLDMSGRLRTLLVITILAWPSFFIAIRLLGTNFQKKSNPCSGFLWAL
jgi:MFS family permease